MDTSILTTTETQSDIPSLVTQNSTHKVRPLEDRLLHLMRLSGGLMTPDCEDELPRITTKITTYTGLTLTPTVNQYLDDFFEQKSIERNQKKQHIVYAAFPDIREIDTRVYWGIFSWSLPKYKQRWLIKHSTIRLKEFNSSPGDIVRDYLDFYHPKPLRCIGAEARIYEQHTSAPLYYRPTTIQEGTYIDIESTYFSILKLVGWNVNYMPERWVIPGRAPLDFPLPTNKGARNYLVTIGLPRPMTVWTGSGFIEQRGQNVHINQGLWRLVMDILHSIAYIAVQLGATYCNTDGYILPSKNAPALIRAIRQWGLNARELGSGETSVFGIGNYSVGSKTSGRYSPEFVSQPMSNLYETPRVWLERNIQKIAQDKVAERLYNDWNID